MESPPAGEYPRVIPRSEHSISRSQISPEALKVLYRLQNLGFKSYLVGGGVRDLYLGKQPKDFDIGTDARPSRLKKIFRNCRIIGRRFRIAHVYFPGDKIVEVATFRRGEVQTIQKGSGVLLIDNEYGTPEEDAKRRDLTINGLFYDIGTFSIIDYVGGVEDLENHVVRTIQDPDLSFLEDPVRMVRALRHASRTGFRVDPATSEAIQRNLSELKKANPARLMEETFKDLRGGAASDFFKEVARIGLLEVFLPTLSKQIRELGDGHPVFRRLEVLDRWSSSEKEISNALLISALLHTALIPEREAWSGEVPHPRGVWSLLQNGFREVGQYLRVSRRDMERVAQILLAFQKLLKFSRHRELSLSYQKKSYLSEALDFLELELESRGETTDIIDEWREHHVKASRDHGERRKRRAAPSRTRRRRKKSRSARGGARAATHAPGESRPHRKKGKKRQKKKRSRSRRRSRGSGSGARNS